MIKELILDIKHGWKTTPNSVKFWNGLVLVGLIITGVLSLEILSIMLGIMSMAALAVLLSAMGDGDYLDNHIWIYFTPLAWCFITIVFIVFGIIKLYERTIVKFNKWLNQQK